MNIRLLKLLFVFSVLAVLLPGIASAQVGHICVANCGGSSRPSAPDPAIEQERLRRERAAQLAFNNGQMAFKNGEFKKAIGFYRTALGYDPNNASYTRQLVAAERALYRQKLNGNTSTPVLDQLRGVKIDSQEATKRSLDQSREAAKFGFDDVGTKAPAQVIPAIADGSAAAFLMKKLRIPVDLKSTRMWRSR